MTLPPAYIEALLADMVPFCATTGYQPLRAALKMVSRAERVAQIVTEAKPFAAALWAALTSSHKANEAPTREAPPGQAANRRFSIACRWFTLLLKGEEEAPFPLERIIHARPATAASMASWSIETDASPWGGGAVLGRGGKAMEYTAW